MNEEDARHILTLYKGYSPIDALYGMGLFAHDRLLTGKYINGKMDVSIVKSEYKKVAGKKKGNSGEGRGEWFAEQFVSWYVNQTDGGELETVFQKILKLVKELWRKLKGTSSISPEIETVFSDIVTNGRDIKDKVFYNGETFSRTFLFGKILTEKEKRSKSMEAQGFSTNAKTGYSYDPGTKCPKKIAFENWLIRKMAEGEVTLADIISLDSYTKLYDRAHAEGITVPCNYCYVEQGRMTAMALYEETEGKISATNFAQAKHATAFTPYKDFILGMKQEMVEKMNNYGGLRIFSFSDYIQGLHHRNFAKVFSQAEQRGLGIKVITKVIEFVDDWAWTGIGINVSIDGNLAGFGMDWNIAARAKDQYENVKIRTVGRNVKEVDSFHYLLYRKKEDGTYEFLDKWLRDNENPDKDIRGLPTELNPEYETRKNEPGWDKLVDVNTPYHSDKPKIDPYLAKGYQNMTHGKGKHWKDIKDLISDDETRFCCQAGGKCWSESNGKCPSNCGHLKKLTIPKGVAAREAELLKKKFILRQKK
jgi:hypothetical protein